MITAHPIPPGSIKCHSGTLIPKWESDAIVNAPLRPGDPVTVMHVIRRPQDEVSGSFVIHLSPDDADRIADQLRTAAGQAREYAKKLEDCKEV